MPPRPSGHGPDRLLQYPRRRLRVLAVDYERGGEADRAPPATEEEEPTSERLLQDPLAPLRIGCAARAVLDDLDADHQPQPPHVAHRVEGGEAPPERGDHMRADVAGVVDEPALEQAQRGERGRNRHRVAPEGRTAA